MFHLFLKHLRLILLSGFIFALLAGVVSFFLPRSYSAESQVLLISRSFGGTDPYTQSKAAERIGENLAQVLKTVDFYNKVLEMPSANFDKERWKNFTERRARKTWQRDVSGVVAYGTGLLNIKVYSYNKDDTAALANAVTQTLSSRGWEYVGGDVIIKIVNSPLVSLIPTRPNFILNIVLGFVLGVLASGIWVARKKKHHVFGGL